MRTLLAALALSALPVLAQPSHPVAELRAGIHVIRAEVVSDPGTRAQGLMHRKTLAQNAGICLHIETIYGENSHHIVETCFKGTARALRQAIEIDERLEGGVPSTKEMLSDDK